MRRILIAYAFASLASLPVSLVGNQLLYRLGGYDIPDSLALMLVWFFAVGVPSCAWGYNNLARSLGVRRQVVPELRVVGERQIGVFADAARMILPHRTITVPTKLEFRYGDVIVTEPEMVTFLVGAWRRQVRGDAPLSRTYWVQRKRMDRTRYEGHVAMLQACNLIEGTRRQGSKNRLRWPPQKTVSELKYRYLS